MAIDFSITIEDALWVECFNTPYPKESHEASMKKFNKWLKRKYHAEIVWRGDFDIELKFTDSKDETFFGLKFA